ncbi:MAG: daunorubicin resistance abc transporter ATP-binding subunit [Peptococcaceae bacterium]|jgi:ABC-2 type transport system ATP-binding protein|nr:daunorubicin resistance abc transporter ATP-binding subunit [Peptococcaceae bacterium]
MTNIIEVRELVKEFSGVKAVNGISFEVSRGEIFGFLGPNGAGKSTTMKILATLLKPTSGYAVLNGLDIRANPQGVRQSIGMVFQETTLDEKLTARENLMFHGLLYNIPGKALRERMTKVLGMVELTERQDSLVRTFSGGMKRRLEIARGLIHYPKVLFLDEPTVGLDPQTRSHIWEYIHELRKQEGLTIFLTTHYMDEAENCDRIAIIDHGQIVALDTPAGLKAQVGGDLIRMVVKDKHRIKELLQKEFSLSAREFAEELQLETGKGEEFIPVLISKLPGQIQAISLHKPTLDDVFLKLTGREIREEVVNSKWLAKGRRWRK